MLGLQPLGPYTEAPRKEQPPRDADGPGPWLRAWVEFQVDARINQALRDLAEGELVGSPSTSGTNISSVSVVECRKEVSKVAEAHAGLLEVVEGLVAEVDRLTLSARAEWRPETARLEASLEDLHVQYGDQAARSEVTIQAVRGDVARLEEQLQRLETSQGQETFPLRQSLEKLEQQAERWQAEVASRLDAEARPGSSAALEAGLRRLDRELASTADAWRDHEARLSRLELDVTASAEAHLRHESCFERLSGEYEALLSELAKKSAAEGPSPCQDEEQLSLASLAGAHDLHADRLGRLSRDVAAVLEAQKRQHVALEELAPLSLVQRLERELKGFHVEDFRHTHNSIAEVQKQLSQFEQDFNGVSRIGGRLERLERELEFSAEAHGRHEKHFLRVESKMTERLERLHREVTLSLEDRYQELSLAIASATEAQGAHEERCVRLTGDLAASAKHQEGRLQLLEHSVADAAEAHGAQCLRLEDLFEQFSAHRQVHQDVSRQLKDMREELADSDIEHRLRQNLQDMERRLDENKRAVRADFESWQHSFEQEIVALQRKAAAELRVEVRTAIRNEAAAVAALDEQLWLTDQRLGRRIDDLEATSSGSPLSPPIGSTPPRQRAQAVMRPITPGRDGKTYRQTRRTAATLAARAVDSVSDASDATSPAVDTSPGLPGMASLAAEALTRNIDLRRRSGGGSQPGERSCTKGLSSSADSAATTADLQRTSLGTRSLDRSAVDQDRDIILEMEAAEGKARSSSAGRQKLDTPQTSRKSLSDARGIGSRSPPTSARSSGTGSRRGISSMAQAAVEALVDGEETSDGESRERFCKKTCDFGS